jgi:hypothetical protein
MEKTERRPPWRRRNCGKKKKYKKKPLALAFTRALARGLLAYSCL